jgi:hypothetical protein
MAPFAPPVPKSPSHEALDQYVGKNITQICQFGFGKVGDTANHCAHFVGHALALSFGTTCRNMFSLPNLKKAGLIYESGASIRVNELYNALTDTEYRDDFSEADIGLIFVTVTGNYDRKNNRIGEFTKKHVGIIKNGNVWHYGNGNDRVRCDSVKTFISIFVSAYGQGKRKNIVLCFAKMPLTNVGMPVEEGIWI